MDVSTELYDGERQNFLEMKNGNKVSCGKYYFLIY